MTAILEIDECRFAPMKTENRKEIMEEPKIMQVGSYSPSSQCNAKVLDPEGICPTLLDHKGAEPAILTPIRTEEQRQLRKQGIDTFGGRQLLPRTDGVSNTITTVQKDNLLQEPCILGYTRNDKGKVESYHEKGVANTLHGSTGSGGNTDQFVREPLISVHPLSHALEFKGAESIKEISPALRATDYKCPHCVYEPQVIGSMQANAMRGSLDGVSPCLTEAMGAGGGQVPMITESGPCGLYDNQSGEFARVPLPGVARTLKADSHNAVMLRYRIRKLTERECFRLMGVDDADIDRIDAYRVKTVLKSGKVKEKPISKSRKYALAGNSIVTNVLYHIFKSMFIDEPPRKPRQLSLFD